MQNRVSPIERVRAEIDQLFGSDRPLTEVLEEVARLSVRLVMQTAVEAEVTGFLARDRYQRRDDDSPAGSRNGWQPPAAVKTTMGPVELQRPKLRHTDERFASALFGSGVTRTNALEALVISAWVRGLSDRDIEASLRRGARARGGAVALDGEPNLLEHQGGVRSLEAPPPRRRPPRLPVPRRIALQDAPGVTGRARVGRLGHRHRRQAGLRRPGAGGGRVHRRLGWLPRRPEGPGTHPAAAGGQRRRPRAARRHRAALRAEPASTLCHPPPPH